MGEDGKASVQPRERLWTPIFILAVAVTVCTVSMVQGLSSGTSVYLEYIGEGAALAGAGAAAFALASAASRTVMGPLADRRGRKFTLVIGILLMLAGTLCPLIVNTGGFIIAWRALQGVGLAAASTATGTIAADVLPYRFLGTGMGYAGLGQALANALGPALAVFLVNTDPHENLYLGIACIGVLSLVLTCFIRYEKNPSNLPATSEYRARWEREHGTRVEDPGEEFFERTEDRDAKPRDAEFPREDEEEFQRRIAANPLLRLLNKSFDLHAYRGAFPMALLSAVFSFGMFFMALYGTTLGIGNAGLFFTITAVVMMVVRLNSGKFMDRLPAISIIWFGAVCGAIAYLILLGCQLGWYGDHSETAFFAAAVPYGFCSAVGMPVSLTMAVKCSDPARWGAANAMYYFCYDIALAVGSFTWGVLNDAFGFSVTLVCVMGTALLSMVVAWLCYPKSARPFARGATDRSES